MIGVRMIGDREGGARRIDNTRRVSVRSLMGAWLVSWPCSGDARNGIRWISD